MKYLLQVFELQSLVSSMYHLQVILNIDKKYLLTKLV